MIDINPTRGAYVTFYAHGGTGQKIGAVFTVNGLDKWYQATMYYTSKTSYDAGTPNWQQNFDEADSEYAWVCGYHTGFLRGMSHTSYVSPVVIKVVVVETDTFEFVAERYFEISFPRVEGRYDVTAITDTRRATVFATVEVKNTSPFIFAPKLGFSIRPIGATQWKDAPLTQGYAANPGVTQTINTGKVSIPITVHGRVYAWLAVYDPDNNELARIGGPGDTSVYFDVY